MFFFFLLVSESKERIRILHTPTCTETHTMNARAENGRVRSRRKQGYVSGRELYAYEDGVDGRKRSRRLLLPSSLPLFSFTQRDYIHKAIRGLRVISLFTIFHKIKGKKCKKNVNGKVLHSVL